MPIRSSAAAKRLGRGDVSEGRGTDAQAVDECLFLQAVLRRRQDFRIGQHRNARGQKRRGLRRHVLEFVGDDVDVLRETIERFGVGVIGGGDTMHHVESGRIGRRREDMTLEAEASGGERQHAAELTAAENPDRGFGF